MKLARRNLNSTDLLRAIDTQAYILESTDKVKAKACLAELLSSYEGSLDRRARALIYKRCSQLCDSKKEAAIWSARSAAMEQNE